MKRIILVAEIVTGLLLVPSILVASPRSRPDPGEVEVIFRFEEDPPYSASAEGIAVDKKGNICISRRTLGGPPRVAVMNEVVRIAPDDEETVLVDLGPSAVGANGVLGVVTDVFRNIYVAFDARNENHGVWKIGREGGAERLPGSEQIGVPNALTFDHQGNLYVTDHWPEALGTTGIVWRYEVGGSFEIWAHSDLLAPYPDFNPLPVPLGGANGIVYGLPHQLYVANTEKSTIVRIKILPDGTAGDISVVAGPPGLLMTPDGLAIDSKGMLYTVIPISGFVGLPPVIRINPATGETEVVVIPMPPSSPLFDFPTSLAFGRGKLDQKSLFVISMGAVAFGFPPGAGSRITQVGVGVSGKNGP